MPIERTAAVGSLATRSTTGWLAVVWLVGLCGCRQVHSTEPTEAIEPDRRMKALPKASPSIMEREVAKSARLSVTFKTIDKVGKPLQVAVCTAGAPCKARVEYPKRPARTLREVASSLSGKYFFVWSKPHGKAHDLDVFENPDASDMRTGSSATSSASASLLVPIHHDVPGFGGSLRWVEGDTLFHVWGCGTGCAEMVWRDEKGLILAKGSGGFETLDEPLKRGLFVKDASSSGEICYFDFPARKSHCKPPPTKDPIIDATWEPATVLLTFEHSKYRCFPVEGSGLTCLPLPATP